VDTVFLQELEVALEDEHRMCEEAKQAVTTLERRRIALTTELEDCRSLLETVSIFFSRSPIE